MRFRGFFFFQIAITIGFQHFVLEHLIIEKNNPKENNRALRPFRAWALIILRKTIGLFAISGLGP
jgi:hypothetical protein